MDYVIIGVIVVTVAVWLLRRSADRRRVEPPEDTWQLPNADGSAARPGAGAGWEPLPVLDREALAHRDRTLDPSRWDNTPDDLVGTDPEDPSAPTPDADAPADLPRHFDRSFLEGRAKERPE